MKSESPEDQFSERKHRKKPQSSNIFHGLWHYQKFHALHDALKIIPPPRIKGRAIFRSRPSTKIFFLSPVQFFGQKFVARPVFPRCFSLKTQKIVARPFMLQNWSPVLFFARLFIRGGCMKKLTRGRYHVQKQIPNIPLQYTNSVNQNRELVYKAFLKRFRVVW